MAGGMAGLGALPGISAIAQTIEAAIIWGGARANLVDQNQYPIDSTATDSGASPTSYLRAGLLLGQVTSTGRLKQYSPTATDGTQIVFGVLLRGQSMLDATGVAENKFSNVLVGGPVKGSALLGLDYVARRQMILHGFYFDDDFQSVNGFLAGGAAKEIAKTADYTIVAADNNTLFTNTGAGGAVVLTLPALTAGLAFEFLVTAAQNVTITSAEGDNVVWDGDAAVDSLAFSTGSHQIGGHLRFRCNAAGTLWYVDQMGPSGCTVTASS